MTLDLDLVGAKEIDQVDVALLRAVQDRPDVLSPLGGDEAEVEAGNTSGRRMKHAEAVPVGLDGAERERGLGRERQYCGAVRTCQRRLADDDQGPFGVLGLVEEGMGA